MSVRATDRRHLAWATACLGIVVAMVGLAYAAVPLYQMFCQATGFGGTTQRAEKPADRVLEESMRIRFDANISPGLAWKVVPVERTVDVKLGETRVVAYRATNTSNRPIVATASFNVAPEIAGQYFNKLECFCFTEQRLEPGQSVDMPVSFFIDPAAEKIAAQIGQITLSYTFYLVDKPATTGALGPGGDGKRS